jgi:hypothetical protein
MGICCVIARLKDETIDELVAAPRKVHHFFSPDELPGPLPVGLIGRLLGKKSEPSPLCSSPSDPDDHIDLDKSWDGLDFLFSNERKESGTCRLLTAKGVEIREELGYGNPQAFRSDAVKRFADILDGLSWEILWERYNPKEMARQKVYPSIWHPERVEADFEYLGNNYEILRRFVRETADLGQGILIVQS